MFRRNRLIALIAISMVLGSAVAAYGAGIAIPSALGDKTDFFQGNFLKSSNIAKAFHSIKDLNTSQLAFSIVISSDTLAIPTGFKATAVMVYGSDTGNTITVYANEIADGTTATSLGTGVVGTEIDITDTNSTATNYLSVSVNTGLADLIYGGYVTIAAI